MENIHLLWSSGLTMATAVIGFLLKEKFNELTRINLLLNKTREEIARDYTTQAEVQRITDHIDQRFNKLEAKIDELLKGQRQS
jgi:histidinol phosphatase-like enzyme